MSKRSLIFTSMGDRPDILSSWIGSNPETNRYDIWVYSYNNNYPLLVSSGLLDKITFHNVRSDASKFQNLAHAYTHYPTRFQHYDNYLILDDDLLLTPSQIHLWIDLQGKYGLDISQPGFRSGPGLQVSWKCTKAQPAYVFHYTSFIEMTAPMFRAKILHHWIKDFIPYSNMLSGWGTDLFYMLTLDPFKPQAYAVIDTVTVSNPKRSVAIKGKNRKNRVYSKNGINRMHGMNGLISKKNRKRQWERVRQAKGWTDNSYPVLQSGHLAIHSNTDDTPIIYEKPYYHETVNLHPIT